MQDTKEAHGQALGEEEVRLTKRNYGWPEDQQFYVPDEVLRYMRKAQKRGRAEEEAWNKLLADYREQHVDLAGLFEESIRGDLPDDWDSDVPEFGADKSPMATRDAGGKVLNATRARCPGPRGSGTGF
jgi:transketolase